MRPRRVTVRIDGLRIVVPLNRDGATIQELIDAASLRFQKATGISASRIQRLELENGGILDPDDIVDDVLNYETEEVLAISDDDPSIPSESSSYYPADTRDKTAIPSTSASSEAFVEIKAFDSTPTLHVRSSKTKAHFGNELLMAEAAPLRSSLRSDKREHNSAPRTVTLSPEVERRLIQTEHRNALERISARKSRISDKFWDAQEKLRDSMSSGSQPGIPRSVSDSNGFVKKPSLIQSIENPFHTIVILANTEELDVGIEITDEFDTPRATPSSAFQITKIDSDGRVGKDGRIRTGDMIVAIDGHSANGLTLLKARALLYELRTRPAPTLTIDRTIQSFHEAEAKVISQKKMALSALQQANSQAVGQTFTITIVRKPNGFGLTVTGRETTKGERLCYIGNVKPDGPAFGQLRSGDRLIKVNGVPTVELQQADIVRRLKETPVGESVTLEISRLAETNDENQPPASTSTAAIEVAEKEAEIDEKKEEGTPPAPRSIHKARLVNTSNDIKEYSFDIPLNDTGSAGLGLSLKARVSIKDDGSRRDCGIFIKKLLVGGAAWKDGRLLVDDQLISIEDIDLRKFEKNADASEAVTKELKRIGHTTSHVRLRVLRQIVVLSSDVSSDGSTRVTIDGPDSTILIGGPSTPQSGFFSINNHHERDASYASTSTRRSEVEEDLQPDAGAFDREAPGRKSMSEKRGMGATIDPINSTTYQKIKHQRQTSAPTSSASRSFRQNRSASTRAAAKARSVSVHPRPTAPTDGERTDTNPPRDPAIDYLDVGPGATTARRRSKSVDANLATSQMRPDDPQAPQMLPTSLSTGFKNPSFKHAVAGEIGPSQDLSPVIAQRFGAARTSDKQQRRKSIGSTMKSWLRIGARSREQSPEKEPAHPHFLAQPGQDYESVLTSTPLNRRDFRRDKVQSEYDPVFAERFDHRQRPGPSYPEQIADNYEQHRWRPYLSQDYGATSPTTQQTNRWSGVPDTAKGNYAKRPSPPPYYAVSSSYAYQGDGRGNYSRAQHAAQQPAMGSEAPSRRGERQPAPPPSNRPPAPTYYDAFNAWFAYSGGGAFGARPSVQAAFVGGMRPPASPKPNARTRAPLNQPPAVRAANHDFQRHSAFPNQASWSRASPYATTDFAAPIDPATAQHHQQQPHVFPLPPPSGQPIYSDAPYFAGQFRPSQAQPARAPDSWFSHF